MGNAICFHSNSPKSSIKYHVEKNEKNDMPVVAENLPPLENLSFYAQKGGDDNYFGVLEISYYSKNIENKMKDAKTTLQEKNIS
jgi:hypothetical protein